MWLLTLLLAVPQVLAALYDTYTGELVSPTRIEEMNRLNNTPWCAIEVADCDPNERRRTDYSCNNLKKPSRGAILTPYLRLLDPILGRNYRSRPAKSGEELPSTRAVRVAIISDGRKSSKHYTHLLTHWAVFMTGDITSVHDTVNYIVLTRTCCVPGGTQDPRCIPIRVADDDVHLRRSNVRCLNLTSAITYQRLGCIPETLPPERINTTPPLLELSIVYGNDAIQGSTGRALVGGRIRTEVINGKEWPPMGLLPICINNEPPAETRCHGSANVATNSVLGVNLFSLWFIRNHNQYARALEALNPCWDDNELFMTARDMNIAMWQQLVFHELMPSVMSYEFLIKNKVIYNTHGHVNDYDETQEPRLSLEYVLASRWFHTMQEGRLRFYDRRGKYLAERAIVDYTLRTGALLVNNTIEGITQGAFRQPAADSDHVVDPDIGERVLGRLQFASDVVASDTMKGRDAGLPPYNHYRALCGLPMANDFKDLLHWMKEEQVEALKTVYATVEDIDLMAGIISEISLPGFAMGPVLACILVDQLKRWRKTDRFWYENSVHPGAFTKDQLYEIRQMSLARLLCDHGEQVDEIQPHALFLSGPGNEMRKCIDLPAPAMEPWRDLNCKGNATNTSGIKKYQTQGENGYLDSFSKYFGNIV